MRRTGIKYGITGVLLCSLLLLAACQSTKTAKLSITNDGWSGEAQSSDETAPDASDYVVKQGDVITLGGLEDLEVTIQKITDQSVTIKTNTPMSDKMDGTINLNSKKTKFTIQKGETLILDTLTMDAGDSFTFLLEE